jgi:hypothetical protein
VLFYVNPKKNWDHWNKWVCIGYGVAMSSVAVPLLLALSFIKAAQAWSNDARLIGIVALGALSLAQIWFGFWCIDYAYKYETSERFECQHGIELGHYCGDCPSDVAEPP